MGRQEFLDMMELDRSKTVHEIGVGTGRLAEKTGGLAERAGLKIKRMAETENVYLIAFMK